MKSSILKTIGAAILTFAVISTIALSTVSAQDKAELQSGGGGRLDGTWNVQVSIRNCQTNAEIRNFASLTTFMSGGTLIDSTSGVAQALKTPGHGIWSHDVGNAYNFSFKSFSFDAAGNSTGWQVIRHRAVMDFRGDSYTSVGTAEFYNASGTFQMLLCSTTTATRFE